MDRTSAANTAAMTRTSAVVSRLSQRKSPAQIHRTMETAASSASNRNGLRTGTIILVTWASVAAAAVMTATCVGTCT